jgi:hypothetical protein
MRHHWLSVILAGALLAGCPATMKVGPADVSQQLAYFEVSTQAMVKLCTTLVAEKRITVEQAVQCDNKTKSAFSMIDTGRSAFKAGNPATQC